MTGPAGSAPGAGSADLAVNATAASLLGFLHDGPATGWDLVARAERTIGAFWSLTRSQVYRELGVMAARGLVTAGEAGRRDARPYTLTDQGREAFAAWAAQGPGEGTVRIPLLLFVTLGRHLEPGLLSRVLREQRAHQAALLAEYTALRRALSAPADDRVAADPHLPATLDYGIAVARATLRWIDRLPPEIGAETVGGLP